jgi:hypothetical protein
LRSCSRRALHSALWTYGQTVGLIVERYDQVSKQRFGGLFGQANDAFLEASRWEKIGVIPADAEVTE